MFASTHFLADFSSDIVNPSLYDDSV